VTHEADGIRHHLSAALALLDGVSPPTEATIQPSARMGIQIDAAELAKLVELADRLQMAPTLVLKLALRALEVELGKTQPRAPGRLVGKERGLLEGKR
jgi:hypothetical protein